ncbi:5-oxoprolinase subunit PxpB [Cesiribacter andamanensis]|uniref:Sporulation inhibitor kipI n=1 Tax=Cesiribacter andamanensis AMV16 TaxID=1279009 RepID=M7NBP3_9BACT|nr:5-oxoprolinase subunit PxpB [Cesiribacter andamanensis]EMR04606.1 Sporulation inhibitor kipI [Cesiribacter andamanensis AMV16]
MPEPTPSYPCFYPLGDAALVVQFGDAISPQVHARVRSLATHLEQHPLAGLLEIVPAYTTLTLYYKPAAVASRTEITPYEQFLSQVEEIVAELQQAAPPPARLVEIPVCYGGAFGPDLDEVARHCHLSPEEVIKLHQQGEYLVYMLGFAPGFAYLGGLPEQLATPRKAEPRQAIPSGSVGIAGLQTGIYPLETPGGWQLIGRCPLQLFDPRQDSPSQLQMGDRLRFVAISEPEFRKLERRPHGA